MNYLHVFSMHEQVSLAGAISLATFRIELSAD